MRRPKLGLRACLSKALDAAGILEAILNLRLHAGTPWLTVLTYHRIREDGEHPFDRGVIDATPDELDAHLAVLGRYFTFVASDEVRDFLRTKRLPKNPILVTFDDGYRECHDLALPILERHRVRATFFVPTSYVGERRVFWWDRLSYLLRRSPRSTVTLEYPSRVTLTLGADREAPLRALLRLVKGHFGLDVERFLVELAAAADVRWSRELERSLAGELVLDWDRLRAMRRAGQEIESHTRTHRVLQTVPEAQLRDELAGSRADLERELGVPARVIAYPVGLPVPANVRTAVRDAGYELGFLNTGGVSPTAAGFDPLAIRRIAMERPLASARFRAMLAIPPLA
jgi:peptidoglycan/xylan/chitin deacetylase (PgdA/CDA1 family)